jgi:hypothetical protein
MKQDGMSDSEFLRSLAYNDYNIDGHLLSDGDRLCAISDRLELFEKTIECLRSERDEVQREVSFLRPSVCLGAQTAHDYAKQRGWDCFKEDTK